MEEIPYNEIIVIGEILRLKIHNEPALIKDRRYHLRTYGCCFVGRDLIDWLVSTKEFLNNHDALTFMNVLLDKKVLHHVCDDHRFEAKYLFYRFRLDDNTFSVKSKYEIYHQGIVIHNMMLADKDKTFLEDYCFNNNNVFQNCIVASNLVKWLVRKKIVSDEYAATVLCQQLLEILIVKPIGRETSQFLDDDSVYQFVFDVRFPMSLNEVLQFSWKDEQQCHPENRSKNLSRIWHLLPHCVTAEELLSPGSPYQWKDITVTSDSVGFGFVVKGHGPCYVQAVDPYGPAAASGLKVQMYIYSVNAKVVLDIPHTDIANEVIKSPVVELVVLEHFSHE